MRDYLVIYDALCGPCARFKRALDFFDVFERIGFVPLREADEEGRLASVPLSARFRSFHVVLPSGEIRSGADALPHLIEQLPAGKVASRLIKSAPFGSKLMRSLYLVASRLHESESCARIERSPSTRGKGVSYEAGREMGFNQQPDLLKTTRHGT